MPTARSMPISRVRSKTVSTSVLTIPNRLMMIDSDEQHVEQVQQRVEPLLLVVLNWCLGLDLGVGEAARAPRRACAVFAARDAAVDVART